MVSHQIVNGDEQTTTMTGRVALGAFLRHRIGPSIYLIDELKRVAMVTATCVGLLIFLTVVDRMR